MKIRFGFIIVHFITWGKFECNNQFLKCKQDPYFRDKTEPPICLWLVNKLKVIEDKRKYDEKKFKRDMYLLASKEYISKFLKVFLSELSEYC